MILLMDKNPASSEKNKTWPKCSDKLGFPDIGPCLNTVTVDFGTLLIRTSPFSAAAVRVDSEKIEKSYINIWVPIIETLYSIVFTPLLQCFGNPNTIHKLSIKYDSPTKTAGFLNHQPINRKSGTVSKHFSRFTFKVPPGRPF